MDRFKVGDPCFAKVRGFIPFPAKIVERKATTKVKFAVEFYGTKETNDVGLENLWEVTSSNIQKFVNKKSLSRKYFQSGYEEMLQLHQLGEHTGNAPIEESGVTKDTSDPETDEEYDFQFDYNVSRKKALERKSRVLGVDATGEKYVEEIRVEEIEILDQEVMMVDGNADIQSANEVVKAVTDEEIAVIEETSESTTCLQCNQTLNSQKALVDHVFDHHVMMQKTPGFQVQGGNASLESFIEERDATVDSPEITGKEGAGTAEPSVGRGRSNLQKKNKSKNNTTNKGFKSLREAEIDLNAAFAEKIEVREDETFHCKACKTFHTGVKLLARSHAQFCGSKKTTGRRVKTISCSECGETFAGKASLMIHTKNRHTMPSYECSTCFKTFKVRKYYIKHLKIHDARTAIVCPFCPKTFLYESYKLRHIKRAHKSKALPIQSIAQKSSAPPIQEVTEKDTVDEDSNTRIEVNQTEVKSNNHDAYFWQYDVTLPAVQNSQSRSYESFYCTLGLTSQEDWDLWQELSMVMNLPVSIDGNPEGFEMAIAKTGNGDEKIMCIGSTINTVDGFILEIVLELLETAIVWSEEVMEVESFDENDAKGVIESILAEIVEFEPAETETEADNIEVVNETGTEVNIEVEPENDNITEEVTDEVPEVESSDDKQERESHGCPFCGASGFRSPWYVRRHISLMHSESIKCKICSIIFTDKFQYVQHAKTCFFWCSKPGCSFHEKRKARVDSHERSHLRDE